MLGGQRGLIHELHRFVGRNPFGFSGRRIGDLYAGLVKDAYKATEWKKYRRTTHTHNPVAIRSGCSWRHYRKYSPFPNSRSKVALPSTCSFTTCPACQWTLTSSSIPPHALAGDHKAIKRECQGPFHDGGFGAGSGVRGALRQQNCGRVGPPASA